MAFEYKYTAIGQSKTMVAEYVDVASTGWSEYSTTIEETRSPEYNGETYKENCS